MFNFFKKTLRLVAPISGKTIDLTQVPDPVFSEKMSGDGVAIATTGNKVVAPCDGTITLLFESNHAFAITTNDGIEILVHVGLDTVTLAGKGFTALKSTGDNVTVGTPILEIDRDFIESKNLSLITPVLIINHISLNKLSPLIGKTVLAGQDVIIEYKL